MRHFVGQLCSGCACLFFFFKQKTAYEMQRGLVGSEMCIRDRFISCQSQTGGPCRMTRLLLAICLALAATLCLSAISEAHRVKIFAYVDGNTIVTDSGYSRGKRVYAGEVEVYDVATGTLLLSGKTDTEGRFTFPIPDQAREKHMDLRLLLKAGVGHQADWIVKYAEFGEVAAPVVETAPTGTSMPESASATVGTPATADVSVAEVEAIVHRQLEPIKSMLAELNQGGPSVTEIVGGVGYIFGLFGIVAYMKSRNRAG
eukprot:TRINITY_DN17330_c0_g3_i1.p1 TRINITY_DN17330_c0_g3~~TRINITY_DN17330_c0_g3_i1.p1  ORF type:complete len:258 (-),score=53.76 TRINITY_DN17330_c0_g3_i1:440-1213(-)